MDLTAAEIASQPDVWPAAVEKAHEQAALLPASGTKVAVVGCGTSFHIGHAWALARTAEGLGETSAAPASELSRAERDVAVCISRSGTTTEVVWAAQQLSKRIPTLGITAVPDSPLAAAVEQTIALDFADEGSVVQTRWATSVLAMLRAHIGHPVLDLISAARAASVGELPTDPTRFSRFVFVGRGWAAALADEAALKMREAAGAWTESYPSMEYRHGPISVSGAETLLWSLDRLDTQLRDDVAATGATIIDSEADPMVELIRIQRAAVALALSRGLDPDTPRHLGRSVVLSNTPR